jgi:6-phosphogluconolactonase
VNVHDDVDALSTAAAATVADTIQRIVHTSGRCSLALSGGNAPRTFHHLLASRHRAELPWSHVHIFWGDERYVPADDVLSNYRMAKETLLDHVPCPPENVHPIPTHFADPSNAAADYETTLRDYFDADLPRFDLIFLGLGEDGHTASLFPGTAWRAETARWVMAVNAPADPPDRISLTLPVLNHAAHVHFIVAGASKAPAVARILSGTPDPDVYPAAAVAPRRGTCTWWLDRAAAAGIT